MRRMSQCRVLSCVLFVLAGQLARPGDADAQPALIGRSKEPVRGVEPDLGGDEILPGRFFVDPPTLENLGFRWYVSGDRNRNAAVAVAYRKLGDGEWTSALPMLRNHFEIVNQDYGPYRVENLFAGSVLFLQPGTEYEVRFTMTDPDGGAPEAARIVHVATRGEPGMPQSPTTSAARRPISAATNSDKRFHTMGPA